MFVTKKNMANAVASVSKQLNDLSETLAVSIFFCFFFFSVPFVALYILHVLVVCDLVYLLTQSTKNHLSNELAKLDWKVEEQTETSKMILNDVSRSSYFSLSPVDVGLPTSD